ncbi:MAG TPA: alpha/beta fold hydrolase [Rudaea sp.]
MSTTHLHPSAFPAADATIALNGPAGLIEAMTALPDPAQARAGTAIICHPHPLQGGTMHNKVVTMVERSLRELGLATVIFNFRGVGASQGAFDEGVGETDDLLAVARWVQDVRPGTALWLAGFSFGSYVALRAAAQLPLGQLISVAPPVGRWDFSSIVLPTCPWLVVQGETDEIVDPAAVFAWVAGLPHPPALVRMPETGHFFHRRLMDLRGAIKNAVRANLPPPLAA